jgi:hypothetical protein
MQFIHFKHSYIDQQTIDHVHENEQNILIKS